MHSQLTLRTALGKHDHVKPLRDRRVRSRWVEFDFHEYDSLPQAFREMVRGESLDLSEMAVVTHLLAYRFGRPLRGLAIPLWSRLPHTNLVCTAASDVTEPKDLINKRVGVRAYAQTSGVWVRGVLATEYGTDLSKITWGTMEDAHLPEYVDPTGAIRYEGQGTLRELMNAGEFAAIMGERIVDYSTVRTVIPEAETAAIAWMKRTSIRPINHILVLRSDTIGRHPWLPEELLRVFSEARRLAVNDGAAEPFSYGLADNRSSLQVCFDYSANQQITPQAYSVDELFESA